jgi:hypothetical protein
MVPNVRDLGERSLRRFTTALALMRFSFPQREFGLLCRDCRTTKMRKRDARAAIAANTARIRLCAKLSLLDWRKVPELAEEFAPQ